MRAVIIRRFGDPEGMAVVDLPDPHPSPDGVVIRTEAIGVGGVDAVIRRGTLGAGFPAGMVPGSEVAGVVAAVGGSVDPSLVGSRVWAFTGTSGGYAELASARVEDLVPLPPELSSQDAVTLGSAAPVARFALDRAHLLEGETVLVRGAGGSIGIAAVELASARGAAAVAVTTSSPARGARLRALGATHVLDRAGAGDPSAPVAFDVVLDVVGGTGLPGFLERLDVGGRLVAVGIVDGYPPADFGTALLRNFQRSVSFSTFSLDSVPRAALARARTELFADASRGALSAVVEAVLPLEDAVAAHLRMDAGDVFGRLVLRP